MENSFSGSSCKCSCLTCNLDAENWDKEGFMTSIKVTPQEVPNGMNVDAKAAAAGEALTGASGEPDPTQ